MDVKELFQKLTNKVVVGIDEVGRGSWAGPLVAGAVVLTDPIDGLADSKSLSRIRREELAQKIRCQALACATGWVSPEEVDKYGLTRSTQLAITRAIETIKTYDVILIDGSINFLKDDPKSLTFVKADYFVPVVSAASIVAKVVRDEYMREQGRIYPQYGFETHVGYGTSSHKNAIVEHGITPLHRKSYKPIKNLLNVS